MIYVKTVKTGKCEGKEKEKRGRGGFCKSNLW